LTGVSIGTLSYGAAYKIAVIGGGAGAIEFVKSFFDTGANRFPVEIVIFEPKKKLGRGVAWSDERTNVLANMRAETLGPSQVKIDQISATLSEIRSDQAGEEYPTRSAIGEALEKIWNDKKNTMPEDWVISHIELNAIDLVWKEPYASVISDDGVEHGNFNVVILALGNVLGKPTDGIRDSDRYIHGWDVERIEAIETDSDVFIKGAGLSSIDATMRLLDNGFELGKRSILWHSRSGTLPFVRPQQLKGIEPTFFSKSALDASRNTQRDFGLEEILKKFESEVYSQEVKEKGRYSRGTRFPDINAHYHKYQKADEGLELLNLGIEGSEYISLWFSVIKLLDEETIPIIWNRFSEDDKFRFWRKYRRDFDRFWAPIPAINAKRLRGWLSNGTIQLACGKVDKHKYSETSGKLELPENIFDPLMLSNDLDSRYENGFDYVIDAAGITSDILNVDNPIVDNLVNKKILIPYVLSGGAERKEICLGAKIDWRSGEVLDEGSTAHGWLYSLAGSLTTGSHRFTNSYYAVSLSARNTAAHMADRII